MPTHSSGLYQLSRVYLYASGLDIPYTLNFLEAWMTGIPVVVFAPLARKGTYFEIDQLITHGQDGFVCDTVVAARLAVQTLLDDQDRACEVGRRGREKALALFGRDTIAYQWQKLFESIIANESNSHRNDGRVAIATAHQKELTMQISSSGVFDALSELRPYDIDCAKVYVGNERDGGYVLADHNLAADVISFGVGPDVTFEIEMAERGAKVFLHDHTVDRLPVEHPRCTFTKKGICGPKQVSAEMSTLVEHLDALDVGKNLTLKIDVEGWEWDVFSTIDPDTLSRFDQIVMEIHWLENLSETAFRNRVLASLRTINRQFTLHHVHANNCALLHLVENFTVANVLEVSYIRTSLVKRSPCTQVFPSALNKANRDDLPDFPLFFYPFIPTLTETYRFKDVVDRIC